MSRLRASRPGTTERERGRVDANERSPYYAEAFSPVAGRCFRFVSHQDHQASPTHCPEPPRWRGSFQAMDSRRYSVEACDGHRAPLKNVRPVYRANSS
jgi:hypothetical protein